MNALPLNPLAASPMKKVAAQTISDDRRAVTPRGVRSSLPSQSAANSLVRVAAKADHLRRRRGGGLLLSAIALTALYYRRLEYDSASMVGLEICIGSLLCAVAGWLNATGFHQSFRRPRAASPGDPVDAKLEFGGSAAAWRYAWPVASGLFLLVPWLIDWLARRLGAGNGMEIVMLTSLAWGAAWAAAASTTARGISLSVICSGFLALFVIFISESNASLWFAYAWAGYCLWWLVANHWEQVDCLTASHVRRRGSGRRVLIVAAGCLLLGVCSSAVSRRWPVLHHLSGGFMPTSGGTWLQDSVGGGVGNGQALVAARNRPTSFGAVDSDLFLESTKPSLFDLISDQFGSAKPNRRVERAQGIQSNDLKVVSGRPAEANQSAGNRQFSTHRTAPQRQQSTTDIVGRSLMFWTGAEGAHLAVERFTDFDGRQWSQPATAEGSAQTRLPQMIDLEGRRWFFDSDRWFPNAASPFVRAVAESLSFTRFRSPVIPSRQGLQMWHIELIDRADFFALNEAGVLSMPGRPHVPDYTVVQLVHSEIDLERVQNLLNNLPRQSSPGSLSLAGQQLLAEIVHGFAPDEADRWQQVASVIEALRREFTLDPDWQPPLGDETCSPLEQFLQARTGPSYLFATAAAQMLGHLGFQTRLVTGFYARPAHRVTGSGDIAILPEDTHVWLELHVGNGYWIPLEPTPGYLPERLSVGWWYRLRQASRPAAVWLGGLLILAALTYGLRGYLLELICWLAWPLFCRMSAHRQVRWLALLLDWRSSLAGLPRLPCQVPRSHFKTFAERFPEELRAGLGQYLYASDRILFGRSGPLTPQEQMAVGQVWRRLTLFQMRRALAPPGPSTITPTESAA